ncbi:MAG TPA: gluconokinase, partial [Flavisolibacter sp.]
MAVPFFLFIFEFFTMQQPYVIGIDIGTGSVKAVAIAFDVNVIASSQQFYPASELKTEQDAAPVFQAFLSVIRNVVIKTGHQPAAISLSAAMHSVMAIDKTGSPLTNAILWSDTRSSGIAEGLRNTEPGQRIYAATGTPLHAMSPLCKIKWWQQHLPHIFAQTAKFISLKEYIWYRLFGRYEVDFSIASATGLFNIKTLQWDNGALDFLSVGPEYFSEPVPPERRRNNIDLVLADAMNISAGTPVFIGGSDGCLANLGSLCLDASVAAITIGTSAAVRVTLPQPLVDTKRMIFNYLLHKNTFVCGGAVN